jgi:hypothetical protein
MQMKNIFSKIKKENPSQVLLLQRVYRWCFLGDSNPRPID